MPITCPTDCTSQPPDVRADLCDPGTDGGEVDSVFFCKEGDGFDGTTTFWTDADDWNAKLDEIADDKIRPLFCIGDKPEPESSEIRISKGRYVRGPKVHIINIAIEDIGDLNYEMMRQLECGGVWRVWFRSGKYLYGGNAGINATIQLHEMIPEANTELKKLMGTIKWESQHSPERIEAPEGLNY